MAVPDPRRHATPAQVLALLLSFLLASGVGGIVVAGLLMPGVAAARTATDSAEEVLEDLPAHLERRPLSQRSTMLAADGTALAEFFAENRVVVPLADVAQHLRDAVVATEDRRFFQHGGVDPAGMLRAVVRNQLGDDGVQGGSTLTQQYVKNVLVDRSVRDGDAESARAASESHGTAGYARKLREARLAIALEKELTKNEILEAYLNIAPFGAGIYGVESAAQRYFSKPAADLDLVESATIAGITQSPTRYDPLRNPEVAQERRDRVLRLMRAEGYITSDELAAGVATPLPDTLRVDDTRVGCMESEAAVRGSGYFCDYVTKVIRSDPGTADPAAMQPITGSCGTSVAASGVASPAASSSAVR